MRQRPKSAARLRASLVLGLAVVITATCEQATANRHDHSLAATVPSDRILAPLDTGDEVALPHSAHPRARPEWDQGPVDDALVMDALALHFRPTQDQQTALEAFLADLQDRSSPLFHQWIDRKEFGAHFGLTDHDRDAATAWLASEGFSILRRTDDHLGIFFSGTAAQVQRVFRTQIHRFQAGDEQFYANATDVSVPSPIGDMLYLVGGLDNVRPRPHVHLRKREPPTPTPEYTINAGEHELVPADLDVIYGLNALYNFDAGAGTPSPSIDGAGMVIAVIGQTSYTAADITNFRSLSGLPTNAPVNYVYPGGSSTFVSSADLPEATLDLSWAGAVARNATVNYVFSGSNSTNAFSAFEYALGSPDLVGYPMVVTTSYAACEPSTTSGVANYYQTLVESAATGGTTVVAAAGDSGAAGCDADGESSHPISTKGLAVELPASVPYVVAAGGTEFNEDAGSYWYTSNDAGYGSVKSYIPEMAWNDTSSSNGLMASGGGQSIYFSQPGWQTGTGLHDGGYRFVPDIAMNASPEHDSYMLCLTDSSAGVATCASGHGWADSAGSGYEVVGGTSAAAPVFAGLVTLLNQAMGTIPDAGGGGLGSINSDLYGLANNKDASGVFNDITIGSNVVPCDAGLTGCVNGEFGFDAGVGYDEVTGLGSVNAWNLWYYYPTATTVKLTASPSAAAPGNTITLTAAVSTGNRIGPGITGDVNFYSGATELKSVGITKATATDGGSMGGSASYAVTSLDAGTDTLKAIYSGDAIYGTSTSGSVSVTIASLAETPSSLTTTPSTSTTFTGSGGTQTSYTWALTSPSGGSLTSCSTGSTTCKYTSGTTTAVTDTLKLTDSLSNTTSVSIGVNAVLALLPATAVMAQGTTYSSFVASGGVPSYTWTISPTGAGVTISTSGVVTATATATAQSYTVTLTDTASNTRTAALTVEAPVVVSPSSTTTDATQTVSLKVSGGSDGGYTWAFGSDNSNGSLGSNCTTGSTTCTYTAGSTTVKTDSVTVTDSELLSATATITVDAALVVSPSSKTTDASQAVALTASGGSGGGYKWAIVKSNSGGTLGSNCTSGSTSCTWTTGATSGKTDTISLTDGNSVTVDATITVDAALVVSPASKTIDAGQSVTLSASGGAGSGYTWTIGSNGSGGALGLTCTAGSTTCTWTAGATGGKTDTIVLTDGNSVAVDATVTVDSKPVVSPSSTTTDTLQAVALTASSGSGSGYTWAIVANGSGGSLGATCTTGSTSCTWTTGSTGGKTDTISLTDGNSDVVDATITVDAALIVSPSTKTTDAAQSVTLNASGGSGGNYTWAIGTNGSGGKLGSNCTSGSTTCTWTTGATSGKTDTIAVTDGNNVTVDATITVDTALIVSPSSTATDTGQTVTLTASGGSGSSYAWASATNGSGGKLGSNCTSGSTTCTWTTGTSGSTTDTISLTDGNSVTVDATVTVDPTLTITPSSASADYGYPADFLVSGGSGSGYTWKVVSNNSHGALGSECVVNATNCSYSVGLTTPATDTLSVTDGNGVTVTATVSSDPRLVLSPLLTTTDANASVTLTVSGGAGSGYTWTINQNTSGGRLGASCTIGSTTCVYTAGPTSGQSDEIIVSDANHDGATSTINIDDALVLSPATTTADTSQSVSLEVSGGSGSGYTWSIGANGSGGSLGASCTSGSSTCTWTTGTNESKTDTISVTDGNGVTASFTITVDGALVLSPASLSTDPNVGTTFLASGGADGGYAWTLSSDTSGGYLSAACRTGSTSCYYVAGTTSGTAALTLTDSNQASVTAAISIAPVLRISPTSATTDAAATVTLTATGGSGAGYTWTVNPNHSNGSFGASCTAGSTTCTYTAGTTSGEQDAIVLSDSNGGDAVATITVDPALVLTPATTTTEAGAATVLTASGGSGGSYTWTIGTNNSLGSLGATCTKGSTTCTWTAGTGSGKTDTLQVTDGNGVTVSAALTVNAAIGISPTSVTIAAGDSPAFTASGGVGTQTWSVTPTTGASVNAGVLTTTAAASGSYSVTVTDTLSMSASAVVTVNAPLTVSPTTVTIAAGNSKSFSSSGGVGTVSWSVSPSTGVTISSTGGLTTTGAASGMYTVKATDTLMNTATATVTVNAALSLSPSAPVTIAQGDVYTSFAASGGVPTYVWTVSPGNVGVTISSTGAVSASISATTGSYMVTVTDSASNSASDTLTVNAKLTVSPTAVTLAPGDTSTFVASGGVGTDGWSVSPSTGATISSAGVLTTTASAAGTYTVTATDTLSNTASATVTMNASLLVSPSTVTLAAGSSSQLGATGGVGTDSWAVSPANGTASVSTTGLFSTTAAATGAYVVTATDTLNNTSRATITVVPDLALTPASPLTVAPRQPITISTNGTGDAPIRWMLTGSSNGSLSASSGVSITYTAGATPNTVDTISVSDALLESVSLSVDVGAAISITPSTLTIASGSTQTFSGSGGDSADGYTWSVPDPQSGGSFSGDVYTAGPMAGVDTIQAKDVYGNTATVSVTVVARLAVTPSSPISVAPRQPVVFSVGATGEAPFTWSLTSSAGSSLSATSGPSVTYTAGSTPDGQDTLTVTDALNQSVMITATVGAGITLSPSAPTIVSGGTVTFGATGGDAAGGYTWSVTTSGQRFGAFTGALYTAGTIPGTDTVAVADLYGNTAATTVTSVAPLSVTPGSPLNIAPLGMQTLTTGGTGSGPFHWVLAPGGSGGSLNAMGGSSITYSAGPSANTVDTISVTDSIGESVSVTVNVGAGLAISPLGDSVVVGGTITFSATGGDSAAGVTWSVVGAHPNGSFVANIYAAGGTTGSDTVQAKDPLGNTATTTVSIVPALAVTPASPITVAPLERVAFTTNGSGVGPFVWALAAGGSGATISATTGPAITYTAGPSGNTSDTLTVTDSAGETASISISVQNGISISPIDPTLLTHGSQTFTASGGDTADGYTWSVVTSGPALGSFAGEVYTAGGTPGVDTIQARDALGNTTTMPVTIVAPLSMTPASPLTASLQQTVTLTAANGLAPYHWTLSVNGSGATFSASGASASYQAGTVAGTQDVVRVTDALSEIVSLTVNVGASVVVSPSDPTVTTGQSQSFAATGGSGTGYLWSIPTNVSGGTFNGSVYTAGAHPGADVVEARDSFGNLGITTVTVVASADAGQIASDGGPSGTDAGGETDAGPAQSDAGSDQLDAGSPTDAGITPADAGHVDGGAAPSHVKGGCACGPGGGDPLSLVGFVILAVLRRRRRS